MSFYSTINNSELLSMDKLIYNFLEDYFSIEFFNKSFAKIMKRHEESKLKSINIDGLQLLLNENSFNPSLGSFSRKFAFFLKSHILPQNKVLDVGCGVGYLSLILAKNGVQVTGIDINDNSEFIKVNSKLNNCSVNFLYDDIANIKSNVFKHKFDYIIANLPFTKIDLISQYRNNKFFDCFAASKNLTCSFIENAIELLSKNGEILFCYGSSGWNAELQSLLSNKNFKVKIYSNEITESLAEKRYIIGVKKNLNINRHLPISIFYSQSLYT